MSDEGILAGLMFVLGASSGLWAGAAGMRANLTFSPTQIAAAVKLCEPNGGLQALGVTVLCENGVEARLSTLPCEKRSAP